MKATIRVLPVTLTSALLLAGCATSTPEDAASPAAAPPAALTARTTLLAADGTQKGRAEIVETADGLRVTVWAQGLPPGTHAAHIHTIGTCTPPDFTSAGGHWNPTHRQHGKNNPQGMHMGDMPNMLLGTDGGGELQYTIPGGKLTEGPNALLDADGAAVVIHAGPDDMMTDPAGNAGGRIACGVLALP